MIDTTQLLIYLSLFILLPLWSIAGFADWLCHRATQIETTSGLKESLMHSVMGIQVGIPIILCLQFEINVLVLLICIVAWVLHELVAHWDVHYTKDTRKISVWEMHAHSYLATLPLFMLIIVTVIKWPVFLQLISLDWQGQMTLTQAQQYPGGSGYFPAYILLVVTLGIIPYVEENLRCLRVYLRQKRASV